MTKGSGWVQGSQADPKELGATHRHTFRLSALVIRFRPRRRGAGGQRSLDAGEASRFFSVEEP